MNNTCVEMTSLGRATLEINTEVSTKAQNIRVNKAFACTHIMGVSVSFPHGKSNST